MHAGEASNAYFLAKRLADRKVEAHVLTTEGNTGGADSGITVHPIMRNWSWREMFRMRAFLRRCSPDAVLLMYLGKMYGYHPMITFAATISKHVLPQVPFVTRFENVFGEADPAHWITVLRTPRESHENLAGSASPNTFSNRVTKGTWGNTCFEMVAAKVIIGW